MKKIICTCAIIALLPAVLSAQTPDDIAREYYQKGNNYYQQGMFKEAQEEYNKAIDILKRRDAASTDQPAAKQESAAQEKQQVPSVAATPVSQSVSSTEYVVGDDDVLFISVWQNDDLNQEAIVRPDGKISVPLIGDVVARGMTLTQLDDDLTRRLSEYVRYPEVSLSLRRIGGSKVIMLGEISKPGVYAMSGQRTLLEAVGMAGGFTRDAVPSSIVLIRGGLANPRAERVNLSRALKGKDFAKNNIVLQAEDVVFVPKKFIADVNYVLGMIVDPLSKGAYIKEQYKTNW